MRIKPIYNTDDAVKGLYSLVCRHSCHFLAFELNITQIVTSGP